MHDDLSLGPPPVFGTFFRRMASALRTAPRWLAPDDSLGASRLRGILSLYASTRIVDPAAVARYRAG
jgi:hypothetical protein